MTNAPYTILDGSTELATVQVNQQLSPADLNDQGAWWQELGDVYEIAGNTLVVRLSDLAAPAGGYLIADAVRIELVGGLLTLASIGPPSVFVEVLSGVSSGKPEDTANLRVTPLLPAMSNLLGSLSATDDARAPRRGPPQRLAGDSRVSVSADLGALTYSAGIVIEGPSPWGSDLYARRTHWSLFQRWRAHRTSGEQAAARFISDTQDRDE